MKSKIIPVREGERLSLSIARFGKNMDPIMFYKGFVIFLQSLGNKSVDIGQLIKIKITKVQPKYAIAELISKNNDKASNVQYATQQRSRNAN